jgi:hypothetical protein
MLIRIELDGRFANRIFPTRRPPSGQDGPLYSVEIDATKVGIGQVNSGEIINFRQKFAHYRNNIIGTLIAATTYPDDKVTGETEVEEAGAGAGEGAGEGAVEGAGEGAGEVAGAGEGAGAGAVEVEVEGAGAVAGEGEGAGEGAGEGEGAVEGAVEVEVEGAVEVAGEGAGAVAGAVEGEEVEVLGQRVVVHARFGKPVNLVQFC